MTTSSYGQLTYLRIEFSVSTPQTTTISNGDIMGTNTLYSNSIGKWGVTNGSDSYYSHEEQIFASGTNVKGYTSWYDGLSPRTFVGSSSNTSGYFGIHAQSDCENASSYNNYITTKISLPATVTSFTLSFDMLSCFYMDTNYSDGSKKSYTNMSASLLKGSETSAYSDYSQTCYCEYNKNSGDSNNQTSSATFSNYYTNEGANVYTISIKIDFYHQDASGWGDETDAFALVGPLTININGMYSITYSLDGGSHGSNHPTTMIYNIVSNVSAPSKTGYHFTGWKITSGLVSSVAKYGTNSSPSTAISSSSTNCFNGATGNIYFKNLTNKLNDNVTISANFSINTGSVKYNPNGGTGTEITDSSFTYNTTYTINASANFTKTNQMFIGWNTDSSGAGTFYSFGQSVTTNQIGTLNLAVLSGHGGSVILYAIYQEIGFTFNGTSYSTFDDDPERLQLLQTKYNANFISEYNNPTGFTSTFEYSTNGSSWGSTKTDTLGSEHYVKITVTQGGKTRGTRIIQYTIVAGDFGTIGGSGKWGSSTNPYVIENLTHLNNLAGIVNGTKSPLNSIKLNDDANADWANSQCTDIHYTGGYFLVIGTGTDTNNSFNYIIGTDSSYSPLLY